MTTAAQLISAAEAANWSSFKSLVLSATPSDIAAIGSDWDNVMFSIASGVTNSAPAPKALFTSSMNAFFNAASPYLTGDSVVGALSNIAQNFSFPDADHLSVEMIAIINAVPSSVALTASPPSVNDTLFYIAFHQSNTEVTPTELKNTYAAYTAKFGDLLNVDTLMSVVTILASNSFGGSFPPTDQLPSVKVLLEAGAANAGSVSIFALKDALSGLTMAQNNPEITPAELNSTLKVFIENYGAVLDVETVLDTAAHFTDSFMFPPVDYLVCARTLLAFEPADIESANPFQLQDVLMRISMNSLNPEVTPEELNNTFKVFLSTYGAVTDVSAILNVAATIASDPFSNADNLASVRTLLQAEPNNKADVNPFEPGNALFAISMNQNLNPEVTPEELDNTLKVFVNNYGALTDVNIILNTASTMAMNDGFAFTNNFASVRTLLGAHPDNAAMADPFSLSGVLQAVNGNNLNPAISEHELAQTLTKFMTSYGDLTAATDLASAINNDVLAGTFEAAGAIVNHIDASQFATVATEVNAGGTAQLLTTGNDSFNGASSGALAVFGGTGKDVIDFSANASSTGRYLDGDGGADTLTGGLGDDLLAGGAGTDKLTGGTGADTFRFDRTGGDHVTDFNEAQGDRIDLHDVLYGDNAGLSISDYVSLTEVSGNTIVSVDTDGAGTAHGFVQVAQLDNTTGLDVNDLYAQGQIIV